MGISRTTNSAKNSIISLLFYGILIVLTFFSRRVFIDALGAELLGLNTTITNLLGLLNLSEMGIATAISFTLFKPIADNDRETIREIVSVQGWVYFIVASIVVLGGIVMMFFIPQIFADTTLSLSYAYATFIVFLFSSLLGYFFNYKQIMHSASQKEYKNVLIVKLLLAIKIIVQIIALKYLGFGYQSWLILEVIFAIITTILLSYSIKREYSWLRVSIFEGRRLTAKYPIIFTKVKQLFFHKIGGFVLSQSSPLVVFAFTSLSLVAVYGNYMLVLSGITTLISAFFGGVMPVIGNVIVENDKEKERKVFGEYMVFKMLLGASLAHCLLVGGVDFMSLWMGKDFLLPNLSFYLLVAIGYINFTRPYDTFLVPYGLVNDIWAPIVEAGLNLGLSVLLGYYFSLPGVLVGVLISLVVIVLGWKGYFLATKGLEVPRFSVIARYFSYTILFVSVSICLILLSSSYSIGLTQEVTFVNFGLMMLVHFLLFWMLSLFVLTILDLNTRNLINRVFARFR